MALTNKSYTFLKENEKVYNIDSYKVANKSSILVQNNGNVILNNTNPNTNTDNFYGDGRLGITEIRSNTDVQPACFYFEKYISDHSIYGPVLWNIWSSYGTFNPGDEIILYKKHAKSEEYVHECGDWEICTVKEIINDDDGIHYSLSTTPSIDFTPNTANSGTLILQYQSLEIFDDIYFTQQYARVFNYVDWWDGLGIGSPHGILFIKSMDGIILGNNAEIGNRKGNPGAHGYRYDGTLYRYELGCSKLGMSRYKDDSYITEDARDSRSPSLLTSHNYRKTPGMPGIDGMSHEHDSTYSNRDEVSEDLNEKIYVGIGGTVGYDDYTGARPRHQYGCSGGGIVIIQTPKILFRSSKSRIHATTVCTGSNRIDNYGTGGSILIKTEEMEFLEEGVVATGTACSEERDWRDCNFSTSRLSEEGRLNVGLPGHIQLECDKYIIEGIEKSKDEFLDIKDYYIYDEYFNQYFVLNDIKNGMSDYPLGPERIEDFSYMSPIYETGTYFKIGTAGVLNAVINDWYNIEEILMDATLYDETDIRVVFSNDMGSNWYYFDFSEGAVAASTSLSDSDIASKSNTVVELKEIINEPLLTSTMLNPQRGNDNRQIDITFALKTDKAYKTPILRSLWFRYNKVPIPLAPIPINPYDGKEFDNEYVDFVWLQPEQKYGSIQNRLQISNVDNFNTAKQKYNTDNYMYLPYKPAVYTNMTSSINNFGPPILVDRTLPSSSYDESVSASLFREGDNIKYVGDEYLINGVPLITQEKTMEIPTVLDYREVTNRNTDKTLTGHILFPQEMNIDDEDLTGNFSLKSINGDYLESSFYGITKQIKPDSSYEFEVKTGNTLLSSANDFTISYRFKIINDYNVERELFRLYTIDTNNFYTNIKGYKVDLSAANNYRLNYEYYYGLKTTGTYLNCSLMEKNLENVLVLKYDSETGIIKTYINGEYLFDSSYTVKDSETDGDCKLIFGNKNAASVLPIEWCMYGEQLSDEDIKSISKIPVKNIRYDITNNNLYYQEVMDVNHLEDPNNETLDKPLPLNTGYSNAWADTRYTYRMNLANRMYANTEKSLRLATICNDEIMYYDQTPNNNFIQGDTLYNVSHYSSISDLEFKENNSYYNDVSSLNARGFRANKKVNYYNTNFDLAFKIIDTDTNSNWYIGCFFKTTTEMTGYEGAIANYYIKYINGIYTLYMYDFTTANSYKNIMVKTLPYDLKEGHIYIFRGYLNGENCSFTLQSETDIEYINELEIDNTNGKAYTRKAYGCADQSIYNNAREYGGEFLNPYLYDVRSAQKGTEPISLITYNEAEQTEKDGYNNFTYRDISIPGVNIQKINRIYTRYSSLSPECSIKYFFKIGDNWRIYDFEINEWVNVDKDDYDKAMTYNEVLKLSEYEFSRNNGPEHGKDFVLRFILYTDNKTHTPELQEIYIDYNGPMTIDSWIEDGSNYTGLTWYYSKDWNVYEDPDFSDENQGWLEMGTGMPDSTVFKEGFGSKPSQGTKKYFGGVRVLLKPKGKYYWRAAAYNGL